MTKSQRNLDWQVERCQTSRLHSPVMQHIMLSDLE